MPFPSEEREGFVFVVGGRENVVGRERERDENGDGDGRSRAGNAGFRCGESCRRPQFFNFVFFSHKILISMHRGILWLMVLCVGGCFYLGGLWVCVPPLFFPSSYNITDISEIHAMFPLIFQLMCPFIFYIYMHNTAMSETLWLSSSCRP